MSVSEEERRVLYLPIEGCVVCEREMREVNVPERMVVFQVRGYHVAQCRHESFYHAIALG